MKDFVPAELLEARWSAWLLDRNRRGTRSLLWIAVTLYPLFGVLDYLVAPRDWLWLLYSTRLVVTLLAVALFRVLPTPFFARHANVIASGYLILGAGGVSLMTVFLGGLASPYYAGLSLIIVATGLLFVWPAEVALVTHGSIVTTFIVVNAATNHVGAPLSVTLNLAFLVSTATVITIGRPRPDALYTASTMNSRPCEAVAVYVRAPVAEEPMATLIAANSDSTLMNSQSVSSSDLTISPRPSTMWVCGEIG